jgi:CubicO group peptidase (beta-lactamase class C family)
MRNTKGTLAGLLVIAAVAAVPSSAMAWPHVTEPWTTTTTTTQPTPPPPADDHCLKGGRWGRAQCPVPM